MGLYMNHWQEHEGVQGHEGVQVTVAQHRILQCSAVQHNLIQHNIIQHITAEEMYSIMIVP